MKSKHLFQTLVLLALLLNPFEGSQSVRASAGPVDRLDQSEIQNPPTISVVANPSSIDIGGIAAVTVSLENVPAEGYTSLELTCSYNPNLVEVTDILAGDMLGTDPVMAINGPSQGMFLVAIAGSNGRKATGDSTVITFSTKGVRAGPTVLDCQTLVSTGNNTLTRIKSVPATLTVLGGTSFCDKAEFVGDVTVPPGTTMFPGSGFTKTWRLRNVGSCTWTADYRVVFLSGDPMNAVLSIDIPGVIAVGQTVDISLSMSLLPPLGSHRGYWMFQNADGALFGIGPQGNEPWFVDVVVSYATLTPTQTPGPSTPSATPTPGGPTPLPGVVYDFVANVCSASWYSRTGLLSCPGTEGDARGFVLQLDHPRLEGAIDTGPGLLTFPQNVQYGYIRGFYPPFHVQNGDRFRTLIGCEEGATDCYVALRLDYQVGADSIETLWGSIYERYDGKYYSVDVDLSSLAGKDVKFILTTAAVSMASEDRALWVGPAIYRPSEMPTLTPSLTPTPSSTPTPRPTPTVPSDRLRYLNTKYWFDFYYPNVGHYVNDNMNDNHVRILFPFTPGTNLYEKYLDVTVVEDSESCRSPLATSSTLDSVGMAFANGLIFLQESGHDRTAENINRWFALSTYRGNVCISFNLVLRATNPGILSTPPPFFDEAAEAAVLWQVVGTFAWLSLLTATPNGPPISTMTPTSTPVESPTPTLTPVPIMGTITGRVLAGERVTLYLFAAGNWPVASILANPDGTFSLSAPAGTYTILADTYGFLSARGSVTVTGGSTSTKPTITLLAGDLDGDLTINQYDAMTIGMNYNRADPSAADLNNDGVINVLDLELLAKNYRSIGPVPWP